MQTQTWLNMWSALLLGLAIGFTVEYTMNFLFGLANLLKGNKVEHSWGFGMLIGAWWGLFYWFTYCV
jgi:hypothetical protein